MFNFEDQIATILFEKFAELGQAVIAEELASGTITEEDLQEKLAEYIELEKMAGIDVTAEDAMLEMYADAGAEFFKEALFQEALDSMVQEYAMKLAEEVAGTPAAVPTQAAAADIAQAAANMAQNPAAPMDQPSSGKLTQPGSGESLTEAGFDQLLTKAMAEVTQAVAQAKTNADKTAAIAAVIQKYTQLLQAAGADENTINNVVTAIQSAGQKALAAPNETQTQGSTVVAELLSRFGF